jgi:hypothetical protein
MNKNKFLTYKNSLSVDKNKANKNIFYFDKKSICDIKIYIANLIKNMENKKFV